MHLSHFLLCGLAAGSNALPIAAERWFSGEWRTVSSSFGRSIQSHYDSLQQTLSLHLPGTKELGPLLDHGGSTNSLSANEYHSLHAGREGGGCRGNVTLASLHATLTRGMSRTNEWIATREKHLRGDPRPLIIWLTEAQRTISELKQIQTEQYSEKVLEASEVGETFQWINWELSYLRESIRADGEGKVRDMSRVSWIGRQILPNLNQFMLRLDAA